LLPSIREGRTEEPAPAIITSSGVRFKSHSVVHGAAQLLLASQVTRRRLDRDMAKQKLDLIKFSTG
jgi:hypothetical protein